MWSRSREKRGCFGSSSIYSKSFDFYLKILNEENVESCNLICSFIWSTGRAKPYIPFCEENKQKINYRAGAGAGAAILTSWSQSRVKMERLHNTVIRRKMRWPNFSPNHTCPSSPRDPGREEVAEGGGRRHHLQSRKWVLAASVVDPNSIQWLWIRIMNFGPIWIRLHIHGYVVNHKKKFGTV